MTDNANNDSLNTTPIDPPIKKGSSNLSQLSLSDRLAAMSNVSQNNGKIKPGKTYLSDISHLKTGRYDTVVIDGNNEEAWANDQTWGSKMVSGVGKGIVLTGTTFLQSTVGFANGLHKWQEDGKFSSFYDNDFNKGLDDINKKAEDYLANYYSEKEKKADWYAPSKLFSANFIWDGIIKNMGFAAGAALSGGVFSTGIKGLSSLPLLSRLVSVGKIAEAAQATEQGILAVGKAAETYGKVKKLSDTFLGSYNVLSKGGRAVVAGLSTTGEAGFEAFNNASEYRENQIQKFKDNNFGVAPNEKELAKINADADSVGNSSFAANVGLLTVTNYVQFPKILGSSYKAEKGMVNAAVRETNEIIKQEGKFIAKEGIKNPVLKAINNVRPYLFSTSEAFEEGAQFAIQKSTQDYFDKRNSGIKNSVLESVYQGIKDVVTSNEGMESVLVGGLSGSLMQARGKIRENSEKKSNTTSAIDAFNKRELSAFSKSTEDSIIRGVVIQEEREKLLKEGKLSDSKDLENDYIINYLTPRIKYGRIDLVKADIEDYKKMASTEEGFAQLQEEGKALEGDTKEAYTKRLDSLAQTTEAIKSLYQSLTLRYGGQVNDKKEPVYSEDVMDKMVYAASKIADYDVRIPQVSIELAKNGIVVGPILDAISAKSDKEYIDTLAIIDASTKLNDDQKQDLKEYLSDAAVMTLKRNQFLQEYNEIKAKPENFTENIIGAVPPTEEEKNNNIKETLVIKTKTGEKNIEVGTEYFLGRIIDRSVKGNAVYRAPKLTILGENADGTIKIRTSNGVVRDISKDELLDYKLAKVSTTLANKTANYAMRHWNNVYINKALKGVKGKDGLPVKGRLRFDEETNGLFFVYIDKNGKEKQSPIYNYHVKQFEGYGAPILEKVGELVATNETSEEVNARLVSEKELEHDEKAKQTAEAIITQRKEIVTQLAFELIEKQEKIQKLIAQKKSIIEKNLDRLNEAKEIISSAQGDTRSKNSFRFKKEAKNTLALIMQLSRTQVQLEDEIAALQVENDDAQHALTYIDFLIEDMENRYINKRDFSNELNEDRKLIVDLIQETGKQINAISALMKSVQASIKSAVSYLSDLIQSFEARYPNVPRIMGQEWTDYIKENPFFAFEGEKNDLKAADEIALYKERLQDLDDIISVTEDGDIALKEAKLENLKEHLEISQNRLVELEKELKSKDLVMNRFREIQVQFKKEQAEVKRLQSNKEYKKAMLGTNSTETQSFFDEAPYEADPKKSLFNVITSTISFSGQNNEVVREHHVRANTFGFNFENFENKEDIRGQIVTQKTESLLGMDGLTDHLKLGSEYAVNPAETITMVMTDKSGALIGVDGNLLTDEQLKTPLDFAIYQVFPLSRLTANYGGKTATMFRNTEDPAQVEIATEYYKNWRETELAKTELTPGHTIEPSFGLMEYNTVNTDKSDTFGNIITKPDYDTKTDAISSGLISEEDLSTKPVIGVATNSDKFQHGQTTFTTPLGRVFLLGKNGAIKLKNRLLNKKESDVIFDSILQLTKNFEEDGDFQSVKSKQILSWLETIVYWGIARNRQTNELDRDAGYNNIWFDTVSLPNGQSVVKLFVSGKGASFNFTPTALKEAENEIKLLLSGMYNNVSTKQLREKTFTVPYYEILSVSETGVITDKKWDNYQSFLLSTEGRTVDEIPLTTQVKAYSEDKPNRKGIYFTINDSNPDLAFPLPVAQQSLPVVKVKSVRTEKELLEDSLKKINSTAFNLEKAKDFLNTLGYSEWLKTFNSTGIYTEELKSLFTTFTDKASEELGINRFAMSKFIENKLKEIATVPIIEEVKTPLEQVKEMLLDPTFDVTKAKSLLGEDYSNFTKTFNFNIYKEEVEALFKTFTSKEDETLGMNKFSISKYISQKELESVTKIITPSVATVTPVVTVLPVPTSAATSSKLASFIKSAPNTNNAAFRVALKQDEGKFEGENWKKFEEFIKANFPQLPVYRVKNMIKASNGRQAWGMLHNASIYLYENAEIGTGYHEVFEAVWKMFTSSEERNTIMNEFRNRPGTFVDRETLTNEELSYIDASDHQIKEQLAEEFREYVISGKTDKKSLLSQVFSDLVKFIKEFFVGSSALNNTNKLFEQIGNGYYANHTQSISELSYVNKGIIDVENAKGNENSEYSIKSIDAVQVHEIMQHLTFATLRQLIIDNKSVTSVQKLSKVQLYENLNQEIFSRLGVVGSNIQVKFDQKTITEEEYNKQLEELNALAVAVDENWELLMNKHTTLLKTMFIEFDENDDVALEGNDKVKEDGFGDARKIDGFRKANSITKLLLASLPISQITANGNEFVLSSIGGVILKPADEVFINLISELHDSVNADTMFEKLRLIGNSNPTYANLYSRLTGLSSAIETKDLFSKVKDQESIQLITSFWKVMKRQNADALSVFILNGGEVVISDSSLSGAAKASKRTLTNAIISTIKKDKNPYVTYNKKNNTYSSKLTKDGQILANVTKIDINKPETYISFLEFIGIDFTINEYNKLDNKQKVVFKEAVDGLKTSLGQMNEISSLTPVTLNMEGRLMKLGLISAVLTNPSFESTYFNMNGERTQSFIGTNAVSAVYDVLSKAKSLSDLQNTPYKFLITDVFTKGNGSLMMNKMFKKFANGKSVRVSGTEELMKPIYVDGTSNETTGKKKESSKLTSKERLIQEINLNLNGVFMNLVPGDASIEWGVRMFNGEDPFVNENSFTRNEHLEIFKNYFIAEVDLARDDRNIVLDKRKTRKVSDLRFFKEILGEEIHNKINKVILTEATSEIIYLQFEKEINNAIKEFISQEAQDSIAMMEKFGILYQSPTGLSIQDISFDEEITQENIVTKMEVLSVNYVIANIELHKIIYSDPYQYSDELKRIKNFNSPRQSLINNSDSFNEALDRTYNQGYDTSDIGYSDMYKEHFTATVIDDIVGVDTLEGYDSNYKESDGQGYISLMAARVLKIRASDWNSDNEKQFRYDIAWEKEYKSKGLNATDIRKNGLVLTELEKELLKQGNPQIKSTYTPLKPIVSGSKNDGNNFNDIVLDKFALLPVSFRMMSDLNKDSNIIKMYNKMQSQKVDYVVFESARKVGTGKTSKVYNEKGEFNLTPFEEINKIPFGIMGIQAEVPSKDTPSVTIGSQVTKLATLDYMEAGVPIDFMVGKDFNERFIAWGNLVDKTDYVGINQEANLYTQIQHNQALLEASIMEGYDTLLKKLSLKKTKKGFVVVDRKKMIETLSSEIFKREVNENIIDSFEGYKNGQVILEATPSYKEIRNILYSIADKSVVSRKISGGMKVQVSSAMLESVKASMNEKGAYKSDVLKFYKNEDGKRVCEIMVGRWFKSDKTDEELIEYFNNDPEGKKEFAAITGVAFRIPTQKQNSIDSFVIKQFLPKEFGDSVIIPSALVNKSGSDFDIDKLSIYFKNVFNDKFGNLKVIKFLTNKNSTVKERYIEYVKNNTDDYKQIVRDLNQSEEKLTVNNKITEYKEDLNEADKIKNDSERDYDDEYLVGYETFKTLPSPVKSLFLDFNKQMIEAEVKGIQKNIFFKQFAEQLVSLNSDKDFVEFTSEAGNKVTFATEDFIPIVQQLIKNYDAVNVAYGLSQETLEAFYKKLEGFKSLKSFLSEEFAFERAEIIAEFTEGDTFKDFSNKSIYAQNSKHALENEYITSLEGLISHELNFDNLIRPNSADQLKDLSEDIFTKLGNKKIDYTSVTNMLRRGFMMDLRQAFVNGKRAIGIAATAQTNHSQNQRYISYIDTDRLTNGNISKEDREFLKEGEIKFENYNKVFAKGKDRPTLSMIKNQAGDYISDIIGQFIDGYVDISKGPWIMHLGATPSVAGTWLFLIKLGVPINTTAYFMNQPIIKDYLQTLESNGYSWLFIKDFIDNQKELYFPEQSYMKGVAEISQIPNEASLYNTIGKSISELSPKEKMEQIFMLDEFLKYSKMANHLFQVQQGSNFDTATLNDPYLVFKKMMQLLQARRSIISSVDDILESSFVGVVKNAMYDIRDAFSEVLLSDKIRVRAVMEEVLLPFINMPDREFVKLSQKAVNNMFDWVMQTNPETLLNKHVASVMLGTNKTNSVAVEMMDFKKLVLADKNNPLYNNIILNNLEMTSGEFETTYTEDGKIDKPGKVDNLFIAGLDNKVYDQDLVIYGFRELKKEMEKTNPKLYSKLLALSSIQSGLVNSKISFTGLIPFEDFVKIYNSSLSNLNNLENLEDFKDLNVFQRTNATNTDIVPFMRMRLIKYENSQGGTGWFNPAMLASSGKAPLMEKQLAKAINEKQIPQLVKVSTSSQESQSDVITYSWEPEFIKPAERARRKKVGDKSHIVKGLFQRVYTFDSNGMKIPVIIETEPKLNKKGEMVVYKNYIYKAINAWGDSFKAQENYGKLNPEISESTSGQQSVIDNGFMKIQEVEDHVITSYIVNKKTTIDMNDVSLPNTNNNSPEGLPGIDRSPKNC